MPSSFHLIPWELEEKSIALSLVLGFVLLVLLLWRVAVPYLSYPHYRRVLDERADRIATNKRQVDEALTEIENVRNDYVQRLQRIEQEERERIDSAVREADAARAEIIAEAEVLAHAIRRRADEEQARERTRQRILFRQQLVRTTLDAAEQAIKENTDAGLQHKLIDDFITRAAGTQPLEKGA